MATGAAAPGNVYGEVSSGNLPSGFKVFTTLPDFLMIIEWVFGVLVWTLVAATTLPGYSERLLQGWVMFVSVTFFVMTTILFFLYLIGAHGGSSSWTALDAFCNSIAAMFYLSAAVLQAYVTVVYGWGIRGTRLYGENVAAVVFAYVTTLSYFIHAIFSLLRWKRSS